MVRRKSEMLRRGSDAAAQTARTALSLLFPPHCAACGAVLPAAQVFTRQMLPKSSQLLCPNCSHAFQKIKAPYCAKCGCQLSAVTEEGALCRGCTRKLRLFEHCFSLLQYEGAAKKAMMAAKYQHKKEYLQYFAAAAAETFGAELLARSIDALVPVPVHAERRRVRGYNQAEVLCRFLSPRLGEIPVVTDFLQRTKKTKAQKELGEHARVLNLQNAFCLKHLYTDIKTVLLVDDIYTTGATLEACTEVLLQSGVQKVYGLCICAGND